MSRHAKRLSQVLESRRTGLEHYIQSLVRLSPIPPQLIAFLELPPRWTSTIDNHKKEIFCKNETNIFFPASKLEKAATELWSVSKEIQLSVLLITSPGSLGTWSHKVIMMMITQGENNDEDHTMWQWWWSRKVIIYKQKDFTSLSLSFHSNSCHLLRGSLDWLFFHVDSSPIPLTTPKI